MLLECIRNGLSAALLLLLGFHQVSARTITSYAALGDSYAASSGAGESYPRYVADALIVEFRDLAAGGALTDTVLYHQLPWMGDAELVTLTVGGNQVDFFGLVNECIYQWRPLCTCEKEMDKARKLVQDSHFVAKMDQLIETAVAKLADNARLLVTGYASFFNEDTDQCDRVSFSKTDPKAFMTKERRRQLNQMLRMLNDVIIAAATAHGATYVDIDELFEGHRFCEANIVEPDPDNESAWFYGMKYRDYDDQGSDHGQVVLTNPVEEFVNVTRVFHPKPAGHQAIADELVRIARED